MAAPKEQTLKAKEQARELYLYTPKTQEEIASIVGVSKGTVSNWKRSGKWEELKANAKNTPGKMLRIYANLVDRIDRMLDKQQEEAVDFDELAKATAALDKFDAKRNAPVHIEKVGILFARFLTEKMPAERDRYLDLYRTFAEWYIAAE